MDKKERFVFKISKVNGTKYLQIWEWNDLTDRYEYVKPCGPAEKLYKKLVKLERLQNETKK